MIEEELLGGLSDLGLSVLAVAATGGDGAALEGGGSAVEDEDRLGTEEEELADAAEEAEDVGIANHLPLLVSHRLHELNHPYARICDPFSFGLFCFAFISSMIIIVVGSN